MPAETRPVPVRTILATIGLVLATVVGLYLFVLLARIVALLVVAGFFAVVLNQPVSFLNRRLHLRRGLATTLVYLLGLALISGLLYLIIRPLVDQVQDFSDNFPEYVKEARAGEGPVGGLVKRYKLDEKLEENEDKIRESLSSAGGPAVKVARSVASGLISLVTIIVLSFLMILYGPELARGGLGILSPPRRDRAMAVAADCGRALTGYVMGNLTISVIAGVVTFVALWAFDVPFRAVLALWVAFADLIPLVGATLGAIPTIAVAFLHSTSAGIGMLIVYIIYQQFENHVLQVVIMSKTVQINQLFVLVSVLIGVELFGFLGALLAIPTAGVIQVIVRDLWDHRQGRFKEEPTIGEDQVPVSEHLAEQERQEETPTEGPTGDGAAKPQTSTAGGGAGAPAAPEEGGDGAPPGAAKPQTSTAGGGAGAPAAPEEGGDAAPPGAAKPQTSTAGGGVGAPAAPEEGGDGAPPGAAKPQTSTAGS